jgi:hypothetical protein
VKVRIVLHLKRQRTATSPLRQISRSVRRERRRKRFRYCIITTSQFGLGFGNNGAGNSGAGVLNQSGGTVQQGGTVGGDWRIGGYASANDSQAYGRIFWRWSVECRPRNFQIGHSDEAFSTSAADRDSDGIPVWAVLRRPGLLNISDGSFSQLGQGNLFIVGEAGTGVVNLSVRNRSSCRVRVQERNGRWNRRLAVGHVAGGVGSSISTEER